MRALRQRKPLRNPLLVLVGVLLTSGVLAAGVLTRSSPEPTKPAVHSWVTGPADDGIGSSSGRTYLITTNRELQTLPTAGRAWDALKEAADAKPEPVNLSDQDNEQAAQTVAAALVYARTGRGAYRDQVIGALEALQAEDVGAGRVLAASRQLAGYVIAADLVGYRPQAFIDFVARLRTFEFGGHGRWRDIDGTTTSTASNWGAWALATRIAISRFVGDSADVTTSARIFAGFLGERSAYSEFQQTDDFDPTWSCGPGKWLPINPASCGALGGAIVEDISRSAGPFPDADDEGLAYSWETLGGLTLAAELLWRAGYSDVWTWGDDAMLRAAQFLHRNGGYPPPFSTNQYVPWVINRVYGVALGPVEPAGSGRQFGFTDWLQPAGRG